MRLVAAQIRDVQRRAATSRTYGYCPIDSAMSKQPDGVADYEEAVADLCSAIELHAKIFGEETEIIEPDIFGDHSSKGSVLRYDDPTEPVAVDDWEVLAD